MSTPNAVAVIDPDEPIELRPVATIPTAQRLALALPTMEELQVLKAYGEMFAASGLFPNVKTWQAAAAIIQYGSQLGIDAFTALKDIYWIQGKPSCDASLINSLIKRDHGGDALMPVESTSERCTIKFKRRDWEHYEESTVTLQDYQHLVNDKTRVNWQTSRKDMLWARNVSQIGRRHFSDTIKGLYTRDELRDADVIEAQVRVIERPRPQQEETSTTEPAPSNPTAERETEARRLMDVIAAAFGLKKNDKKTLVETAENLICWRYGLQESKLAVAEEIAAVRAAVESWQAANWVQQGHDWIEKIGAVQDEEMAIETGLLLDEAQVDDPFVHAALADRLAEFERQREQQLAAVDAAVDRAVQI